MLSGVSDVELRRRAQAARAQFAALQQAWRETYPHAENLEMWLAMITAVSSGAAIMHRVLVLEEELTARQSAAVELPADTEPPQEGT